jgi:aromatic ring-opening dioxygenase catalytic subunit (LigB family)
MLAYQINLDTQSLTVTDSTKTIYHESGFTSYLLDVLYAIVGQRLAGYMLMDHLEVYQVKRNEYIQSFLAM